MPSLPTVPLRALRPATFATVVATGAIVVTGAAVRLTDSGLGCPTWPRCTAASVASGSGHGLIEFGNRVVSTALFLVVAATLLLVLRLRERRRDLRLLAGAMVAGYLGNAVIGGITVLTHLDPWAVSLHLLWNMALLVAAVALHVRAGRPARARPGWRVSRETAVLAAALPVVGALVLAAGTLTTGTGPHAGDRTAPRLRLLPLERITAAHAELAMLMSGLVLALLLVTQVSSAPPLLRRRAAQLGLITLVQVVLGFTQYLLHLPPELVLLHVAGATVLWIVALGTLTAARGWEWPATPPAPRAGAGAAEVVVPVAAGSPVAAPGVDPALVPA